MFYEAKHLMGDGLPIFEKDRNFSFPPHIHSCFEVILVTLGEMSVTVGSDTANLKKGEAAFVFPDKVHSLKSVSESEHCLCIFSPGTVNYYARKVRASVPESPFFTMPPEYSAIFTSLCGGCGIMSAKGILYLICDFFDSTATYRRHNTEDDEGLLFALLSKIENSYTSDCTLKTAARELEYDYVYISKFFKRKTGISFNDYVNKRRIDEALRLLTTTDKSILEIGMECGYNSLRSFNRNFLIQTGSAPAKYRKEH